ncbi:Uncharacterised protein [Candidatus Gugararchaeum adminiculabundum]|nr:Uncharacterised protein [Candidatus Gugararchaeum adminiculabundum]
MGFVAWMAEMNMKASKDFSPPLMDSKNLSFLPAFILMVRPELNGSAGFSSSSAPSPLKINPNIFWKFSFTFLKVLMKISTFRVSIS